MSRITHRIIVCADDFGLSPGISKGILELIDAGRLSATSCMTVFGDETAGVEDLVIRGSRIDIGLHLVFTNFQPLGPMKILAPNGVLPSIGNLVSGSLRGILPLAEIRDEAERQMDAFTGLFGRLPDYLDGHHHIHHLPGIRNVVADLLADRRISKRIYLRSCTDPIFRVLKRQVSIRRTLGICVFGKGMKRIALRRGIPTNNRFAGVYDFSDRVPYGTLFERFLIGTETGDMIMCHPGYVDETLRQRDHLTSQRESEFAFLMGEKYPRLLKDLDIELARFADCVGDPA